MGDIQQVNTALTTEAACVKEGCSEREEAKTAIKKARYPYGAVFFLLTSTVGQRFEHVQYKKTHN